MDKIGIVIPIYKGSKYAKSLLQSIKTQSMKPHRILIIETDSNENIDTKNLKTDFEYFRIESKEFNHGATRNKAAEILQDCEILVFITQDIMPYDNDWLLELTKPIFNREASMCYSKQIAHKGAGVIERVSRVANFEDEVVRKDITDVKNMGIKAFYCSNASLAVFREDFHKVSGFPDNIIVSEDWVLGERILSQGGGIIYNPRSIIWHSHEFNFKRRFNRYFDLGVSMSYPSLSIYSVPFREIINTFLMQCSYVLKNDKKIYLVELIADGIMRYIAMNLGKRHGLMPKWFKKLLSEQKYYWN